MVHGARQGHEMVNFVGQEVTGQGRRKPKYKVTEIIFGDISHELFHEL